MDPQPNPACRKCGELIADDLGELCSNCNRPSEPAPLQTEENTDSPEPKSEPSPVVADTAEKTESVTPPKSNGPSDLEEKRLQEQRRQQRQEEIGWYTKELRLEDTTSPKYFLVDRTWWRLWMAFRHSTGDNPQPPGPITNEKLANNGELRHNICLPDDKYRPSPDAEADIVTEELWNKLKERYGLKVEGAIYDEDCLKAPGENKFDKYKGLRMMVERFKHSPEKYP